MRTEGGEAMQDQRRIITMLQKRDETALQEIRSAYGNLCFKIAQQMLGNAEDAEECVNDMLLAVWNAVPPHDPQNLEAFLVTLLRRAAMVKIRQMQSRKRGGKQFAQALDELSDILPSDENVETEYQRRELTDALRRFLNTLPAQARHVFLQRYLLTKPIAEIAAEHQISVSAVKVMLHRTRNSIREHLKKEGIL